MNPDLPDESPGAEPVPASSLIRGLDLAILLGGTLAIFLLGTALVTGLSRWINRLQITDGEPSYFLSVILGLLEGFALIAGVYLYAIRRGKITWSKIVRSPLNKRWFWISLLISALVIPLAGVITALIQLSLGRPLDNPQLDFVAPEGFSWLGFIGILFVGGFLAPLVEEVFFRGVLFQWMRAWWGFWPGVLFSSALFGLLHGEISIAGAAFVLGVILAYMYEKSNSLWPPVIVHVLNNSLKIIFLYVLIALGVEV